MVRGKEWPEEGDLVVGTVREVQNFGAFVTLEEFPGKEGFLHIAEVSAGWVKRIRDHVREQQKVVCKVLSIDTGRGHVDLSLKRVNDHQRRETIQEWKNETKAQKLLELVAQRAKKTPDEAWTEIGEKVAERFGSLYASFEAAATDEEVLTTEGFKGKWAEHFNAVASENIQVPFVDLKGYVELTVHKPDGVKWIREALKEASVSEFEDVQIAVKYIGAPIYMLKVRAPDYKVAEQQLQKAADAAIAVVRKHGGIGEFKKDLKELKEVAA